MRHCGELRPVADRAGDARLPAEWISIFLYYISGRAVGCTVRGRTMMMKAPACMRLPTMLTMPSVVPFCHVGVTLSRNWVLATSRTLFWPRESAPTSGRPVSTAGQIIRAASVWSQLAHIGG